MFSKFFLDLQCSLVSSGSTYKHYTLKCSIFFINLKIKPSLACYILKTSPVQQNA